MASRSVIVCASRLTTQRSATAEAGASHARWVERWRREAWLVTAGAVSCIDLVRRRHHVLVSTWSRHSSSVGMNGLSGSYRAQRQAQSLQIPYSYIPPPAGPSHNPPESTSMCSPPHFGHLNVGLVIVRFAVA